MWLGRPAVYTRDLPDSALAEMQAGVRGYVLNGQMHRAAFLGQTED
jgi:hypothetical protein